MNALTMFTKIWRQISEVFYLLCSDTHFYVTKDNLTISHSEKEVFSYWNVFATILILHLLKPRFVDEFHFLPVQKKEFFVKSFYIQCVY